MSKRYLLVVGLVIAMLGCAGVLAITSLGSQPHGERTWTEIPARIRFLAGDGYKSWLEHATPDETTREVARVYAAAASHARVATLMLGVMAFAGLLALLRLRVRGPVVFAVLFIVLALLGGGVFLVATDGIALAVPIVATMLLASVALVFASNLMPDFSHPFVQLAERELLELPASRRRGYVVRRVVTGAALLVLGIAATVASFVFAKAAGGGVAVVALGAIAGGLSSGLMPLLAATRISLRRR
jgi:hypothetical protein